MNKLTNPTVDQVVDIWCTALESGRYKQGRRELKTKQDETVTHCCLGVLCELYQKHVGDLIISNNNGACTFDDETATPPEKVMKWSGLANEWGKYGHEQFLYRDNDMYEKSFKEIAEIIRANKKTLFTQTA